MPTYYDEQGNPLPASPAKVYYNDDGTVRGRSEPSSVSPGAVVAGGAGIAALGAMGVKAAQAPGGLPGKAFAFAGQLNALRQQAMLSGFALPKSILGGVGASVANSIERKTLDPLKTLLSGQTVRDIGSAWKTGRQVGPAGSNSGRLPKYLDAPGRAIGAVDTAIQNSLVRSGVSTEDAATALLQKPLPEGLSKSFDNPLMNFMQPFRRTPFNALIEGGKASGEHPGISLGYGLAGATQGAAQSDEQYPVTAGLGVAASAKYGLPNAIGQVAGRYLADGQGGGGIMGSALPVSEYGYETSITNPIRPFEKPAFVTFLEKLGIKPR